MAVTLGDNIQNNSPKALDNRTGRFVSGGWRPYLSIAEANQYIPQAYRFKTLTVWIAANSSTTPVEYCYLNGVTDGDLVVKPGGEPLMEPFKRTSGPYRHDNPLGGAYGSHDTPITATSIAFDATNAQDLTSFVIYHRAAAEPTFSGGTVSFKKGTYEPNAVNEIYVLRGIGNRYTINIISNASGGTVDPPTDPAAPPAPTALAFSNTQDTTSTASWTPPADTSDVAGYNIYVNGTKQN